MPEIALPAWVEPHKHRAFQLLTPKPPEAETGINLGYQQIVGNLIFEQEGTAAWAESREQSWVKFVLGVDIASTELKEAIQQALIQFISTEPRISRNPSPEYTNWPKEVIRPHEASAIILKFGLLTGEQKGPLYVARELGFLGKHSGSRVDMLIKNGFHRLGPTLVSQYFLQETRSAPKST